MIAARFETLAAASFGAFAAGAKAVAPAPPATAIPIKLLRMLGATEFRVRRIGLLARTSLSLPAFVV